MQCEQCGSVGPCYENCPNNPDRPTTMKFTRNDLVLMWQAMELMTATTRLQLNTGFGREHAIKISRVMRELHQVQRKIKKARMELE